MVVSTASGHCGTVTTTDPVPCDKEPDMQTINRVAERQTLMEEPVANVPTRMSFGDDLALVVALLAPLTVVGLLLLVGVDLGVAVCVMFVSVFALTTTMDVRWLRQQRRAGHLRRFGA
jgi:hypothetical protein